MTADINAPLTETQVKKLDRLKLYRTRYEIAAMLPDGSLRLAWYGMKSMIAMHQGASKRFDDDTARLGVARLAVARSRSDAAAVPDTAVLFPTGRTQRQAIIEGELVF